VTITPVNTTGDGRTVDPSLIVRDAPARPPLPHYRGSVMSVTEIGGGHHEPEPRAARPAAPQRWWPSPQARWIRSGSRGESVAADSTRISAAVARRPAARQRYV